MSLIGKVLAFLNLLGVAAFAYFATTDYEKIQSWKYANFVYDIAYNGLPLDAKETDKSGEPIAERISQQAKQELFPNGNAVTTQLEEVKRVRDIFDKAIATAGQDKTQQIVQYARYLLPFAETFPEREKLLVLIRNLSATEKPEDNARKLDTLKASLYQGIGGALRIMRPDQEKMRPEAERRTFPDAMQEWVNLQHIQPRDILNSTLLETLPKEGSKPFAEVAVQTLQAIPPVAGMDEETDANRLAEAFLQNLRNEPGKPGVEIFAGVFDAMLGRQVKQLQTRFEGLFKEATDGRDLANKELSPEMQKQKIANLLFNLVEVTPDAAAKGADSRSVINDPAYRRLIKVVGLPATSRQMALSTERYRTISGEINPTRDRNWLLADPSITAAIAAIKKDTVKTPEELARILTDLGVGATQNDNFKTALQREQTAFVLSHLFWVNFLQERAAQVEELGKQVQRAKSTADNLETVVNRRQADIEHWKKELETVRNDSNQKSDSLDAIRQELFKVRLDLRNSIDQNQQYERELNRMEDRVR